MRNSNASEAAFTDSVPSPLLNGTLQGQQSVWRVTGVAITHKFAEAEV